MKDYKRLTTKCEVDIGLTETSGNLVNDYEKVINRLDELEDKIDERTLVNIPYEIGQELYCVFKNSKDVENVHVSLITIKRGGSIDIRLNNYYSDGSYCGCFKYDPKYHLLFHTKTKALKKLKELIKAEVK